MRPADLLSLFATLVQRKVKVESSTTAIQPTDILASPTLSCEGTLTYTGYVPLQTVTITVDGNYTYTGASNGSLPTAPIFYTPPPACASVVVPEPLPGNSSSSNPPPPETSVSIPDTSSTDVSALPPSERPVSTSTSVSTRTWTQTLTDTFCTTILVSANTTGRTGAPYANSSTSITALETRSCTSTLTYITWTDSETYSAFVSTDVESASPRPPPAATTHGFVPLIPHPAPAASTIQSENPGARLSASLVSSSVATVTVTKKTPVVASASKTTPQIAFPGDTGVGSVNAIISRTTTKTSTTNGGGANTGAGTQGGGSSSPTDKSNPGGGNNNGGNNPTTDNSSNGATKGTTNGGSPTANNGNNLQSPGGPATESNKNIAGSSSVGGSNNPVGSGTPTGNKNNPTGGSNDTPANGNNNNNPTTTSSRGGGGIGSIINSAFNSPFTSVGVTTSYGAASAAVTLVNGVPVQIESSSVYIGGSYVALPSGSSIALVTIAGQTFTIEPDAVIAGSSTLEIQRPTSVSYSPVQAATLKASTITQNGVVVTIEPTAAIVNGKTYSIGLNAEPTTVTIDGQTVTLNSNGVAFASTTYRPAMTTAAAYVVTTIGGLTFSIDSSQAIISGTTYRIGAGALNTVTTTTIDGTTIIFGPSGIILPSTTIAPTGVSLTSSNPRPSGTSGSATVRVVSDATSTATVTGNTASHTSRPSTYLSNTLCILSMFLALSTLPLSLLL